MQSFRRFLSLVLALAFQLLFVEANFPQFPVTVHANATRQNDLCRVKVTDSDCPASFQNPYDITFEQFSQAVTSSTDMNGANFRPPHRCQWVNFVNGISGGGLESKDEAAMMLANVIQETAGLQFVQELYCTNPDCSFTSTNAAGCIAAYDDPPECVTNNQHYYGRGYIQLTHCYNYKKYGDALGRGTKYVEDANSAANERDAWDLAFQFWLSSVRFSYADQIRSGLMGYTINAINPTLECRAENPQAQVDKRNKRFEYYINARNAFGLGPPADNFRTGCPMEGQAEEKPKPDKGEFPSILTRILNALREVKLYYEAQSQDAPMTAFEEKPGTAGDTATATVSPAMTSTTKKPSKLKCFSQCLATCKKMSGGENRFTGLFKPTSNEEFTWRQRV